MINQPALSLCRSIPSHYDTEIVRTPGLETSRRGHMRPSEDHELFGRALAGYSSRKKKGDFVRPFMPFSQDRRVVQDGIEGGFAEVGVSKGLTAKLLPRCCEGGRVALGTEHVG